MVLLFALLCTAYFGALNWTLYSVLSSPAPTPRPWLLGTAAATALLVVLNSTSGPLLGLTTGGSLPLDKLFFLLKFSGGLIMLKFMSTWARAEFTRRRRRWTTAPAANSRVLAVHTFLSEKLIYGMVFLYQVLAIWVPRIV